MCLAWRELQTNKLCQHSVCSLKSRSQTPRLRHSFLCHSASPTPPPGSSPLSPYFTSSAMPSLFSSFPSFTSTLFNNACVQPPRLPFPPPLQSSSARAQAGRQASRLGAQMALVRGRQLRVSEPAGRQDGPSVADMAKASAGTCP